MKSKRTKKNKKIKSLIHDPLTWSPYIYKFKTKLHRSSPSLKKLRSRSPGLDLNVCRKLRKNPNKKTRPDQKTISTHSDGRAGVKHPLSSHEPFSPIHGNGPHHALPQVLRHLQNQPDRVIQHLQRRQDRRQPLVEPDVDDGPDDLADLADGPGAGELVGDLSARGGGFGRGGWGWGWRGCWGGVVEDAVEEEAGGWGGGARGGWFGEVGFGRGAAEGGGA